MFDHLIFIGVFSTWITLGADRSGSAGELRPLAATERKTGARTYARMHARGRESDSKRWEETQRTATDPSRHIHADSDFLPCGRRRRCKLNRFIN